MQERKLVSKVPMRHAFAKKKSSVSMPFEEVCGFRGHDAAFYYLNPWEFTKSWSVEFLKAPNMYEKDLEPSKTEWMDGGKESQNRIQHFQV